jgi:hypothetical protein
MHFKEMRLLEIHHGFLRVCAHTFMGAMSLDSILFRVNNYG